MEGENGSLVSVLLLYGCVRCMYVCAARGLERHPFALAASEGRHHHIIVDVAIVASTVLYFHSSENAAQAASSAGVPGAAGAGGGGRRALARERVAGPRRPGGGVRHAEVRGALRRAHDVGDDAHVPGRGRSLDH